MSRNSPLSLACLLGCVAAGFSVATAVETDPAPRTNDATQLRWAAEQAAVAQAEQQQLDLERLAELQQEMEQLAEQVGSEHPRLQRLERKLGDLRHAYDQRRNAPPAETPLAPRRPAGWSPRRDLPSLEDQRVQPTSAAEDRSDQASPWGSQDEERVRVDEHVRQAMDHLHAAGMGDLAERVRREVQRRQAAGWHDRDPGSEMPWSRRDMAPGRMDDLQRAVDRLSDMVGHIERRVRESEEVRHAVHEMQRHVGKLQQQIDRRLRDIEKHIEHRSRNAEEMVSERSKHLEEAVETIEAYVHEAIEELEERLSDLRED